MRFGLLIVVAIGLRDVSRGYEREGPIRTRWINRNPVRLTPFVRTSVWSRPPGGRSRAQDRPRAARNFRGATAAGLDWAS